MRVLAFALAALAHTAVAADGSVRQPLSKAVAAGAQAAAGQQASYPQQVSSQQQAASGQTASTASTASTANMISPYGVSGFSPAFGAGGVAGGNYDGSAFSIYSAYGNGGGVGSMYSNLGWTSFNPAYGISQQTYTDCLATSQTCTPSTGNCVSFLCSQCVQFSPTVANCCKTSNPSICLMQSTSGPLSPYIGVGTGAGLGVGAGLPGVGPGTGVGPGQYWYSAAPKSAMSSPSAFLITLLLALIII